MVTRASVTPQMLNCVLVTIAMVFCHKLTQASWCCAVSASLEVNLLLGNKVLPDPAHPGGVAVSGQLHCHCVSRNSSFAPHLPKANCFFIRKHSLSLEFYCSLADLSLSQTICEPTRQGLWLLMCAAELPHQGARGHGSLRAHHCSQGELGHPQDGCTNVMWRCLKAVWLCLCSAVLEV